MKPFSWALLTAVIWGFVPLLEKIGLSGVRPQVGLYARCVGIFTGLLFYAFLVPPHNAFREMNPKSFFFLAFGGFIASFVGQFVFYQALKAGEASKVTAVAGIYPLITFFLALIFLSESITVSKLCGIALVVFGVMLLR
ncbi:MAG TPA: EamA family transporter [Candidatus Omnitrophota bacterium]|nr:EamA family transporter [Candidatus Omnitrophota bacterium]